MAYYPSFDDAFISGLMEKHQFTLIDFTEQADSFGLSLKTFFETGNPLIFFIFDELQRELIDKLEEYQINDELLEKIREQLYDFTHINACCSSFSCIEVFENLQDEIKNELINNDNLEDYGELKELFEFYNC